MQVRRKIRLQNWNYSLVPGTNILLSIIWYRTDTESYTFRINAVMAYSNVLIGEILKRTIAQYWKEKTSLPSYTEDQDL